MEVVLTLAETNRLRVAHGLRPIPEPQSLAAAAVVPEGGEREEPVQTRAAWTIEGVTVLDGVREALLDDWLADLGTTKHTRTEVSVEAAEDGGQGGRAGLSVGFPLLPINHTLEQIRSMASGEVLTVDANVLDEEESGVALVSGGVVASGGFVTGEEIDLKGEETMAREMVVTRGGVETRRRRVLFSFQDEEQEPEMEVRKRRKGKGRSRRGQESVLVEVPLGIAGTFEEEDDGVLSVVVARPVRGVERVAAKEQLESDVSWVDTLVKARVEPETRMEEVRLEEVRLEEARSGKTPSEETPSEETPTTQPVEASSATTTPSFSSLSSTLEFLKSRNALPAHSLDGRLHAHRVALAQAQRNTTGRDSAALLDDANERLEHYAPAVHIEYKDEDGQEVDTKGAFKVLSRRFHGTKGKRTRKPANPQSLLDG